MRLAVVVLLGACGRLSFDAPADADEVADTVDQDQLEQETTVVHRYEAAMTAPEVVLEIEPVDPDRTLVLCDFRVGTSNMRRMTACHLANATTLFLNSSVTDARTIVKPQVIQFPRGYASVQRGQFTLDASQGADGDRAGQIVELATPVNLAHAFVTISRHGDVDDPLLDSHINIAAALDDERTLRFYRRGIGTPIDIAWQVIEIPDAEVRSTLTLVGAGQMEQAVANGLLSPNYFGAITVESDSENESSTMFRIEVRATEVVAVRNTSEFATISAFAVSPPGATISVGTAALGTAVTTAIPVEPLDTRRTSVHLSMSGGRTNQPNDLDDILTTPRLTETELVLERGTATPLDVNVTASWQLVTWP